MVEKKKDSEKAPEKEEGIEYSVFVYPIKKPGEEKGEDEQGNGEEKILTTQNMEEAMKHAEEQLATQKYTRVEVKKKFADPKNGRVVDIPLKVLEFKPKAPLPLAVLVLFAVIAGAAAFGLTFFLTKS